VQFLALPCQCGMADNHSPLCRPPRAGSAQVYLILDEFIMAGEIEETSKRVCSCAEVCVTCGLEKLETVAPCLAMTHPPGRAMLPITPTPRSCSDKLLACCRLFQVILDRLAELEKIDT
jgi:hypothetical protein